MKKYNVKYRLGIGLPELTQEVEADACFIKECGALVFTCKSESNGGPSTSIFKVVLVLAAGRWLEAKLIEEKK